MKNRILFLGTVIFASHVVFGETLVTLPQPSEIVSQIPVPFEQNIAASLISRGLEEQAAKEISQECVKDIYHATLHTHMLSTKFNVPLKEVYDYIASQALFQKSVDLRSHGDVVAMLQKIKGFEDQKEMLKNVEEYIAIV